MAPRDASGIWQAKLATAPARLPTAPQFTVEITHEFADQTTTSPEPSRIRTVGYRYEFNQYGGRELFAYHLHPTGASEITHPHLHVALHDPKLGYGKKHLVTGLVSLPDVIRCLITEFDIPPLRPDWRDILTTGTGTIQPITQD